MDWKMLVVLDACRFDLLSEATGDFPFLYQVDGVNSVGSSTPEWMQSTFTEDTAASMANTAYVTGNPNSAKFVDEGDFALLDEVWRYAWDDDVGTIRPAPLTDQTIRLARSRDFSRILVHYMQPHEPFLSAPELGGSDTVERITGEAEDNNHRSVWTRLQAGEVSRETVWSYYRENLRLVLSSVERLLDNVDAQKAVITSDHGNALGEWGLYGHPRKPVPILRKVPWVETRAEDSRTHTPERRSRHEASADVESRLKDLGYY